MADKLIEFPQTLTLIKTWKSIQQYPNQVCHLRTAQTLSEFPHTRFNQWKSAYFLSREDFVPRLAFSLILCLALSSSLQPTFLEFRGSNMLRQAANTRNTGDIG
jgi:hypothetical protein